MGRNENSKNILISHDITSEKRRRLERKRKREKWKTREKKSPLTRKIKQVNKMEN